MGVGVGVNLKGWVHSVLMIITEDLQKSPQLKNTTTKKKKKKKKSTHKKKKQQNLSQNYKQKHSNLLIF